MIGPILRRHLKFNLKFYTLAGILLCLVMLSAGPIPMMIGAELFRQGPRPKAMAVAGVVNWVGTFVIALSFESIAVSELTC